jgi:tRNA(Ile)-lysidine synthase
MSVTASEEGEREAGVPLPARVGATIRRHHMLTGGETVVVAASGGPDSTALVRALLVLRPTLHLTVHLAHLNHGLRPDAGEDAAFVREMSRVLGVEYHEGTVDARVHARAEGLSLEDAARRLRYEFLIRTARETGAAVVATGHTLDDQAETVLMRLLRGTGPEGLAGIPPVRAEGGVHVIRPLIETTRADIEAYLKSLGIRWREDATNQELTILRNRIRLVLVPILEGYNPDVRQSLARLADLLRDEADALEALSAPKIAEALSGGPAEVEVALEPFARLPVALQRRTLRAAVQRVRGNLHTIGFVHIEGARRLVLEGHPGAWLALPGGVRVRRLPASIEVTADERPERAPGEYRLPVPGRIVAVEFGLHLKAEELAGDQIAALGRTRPNEVILDRAQIGGELVLRGPRRGDRFTPAGMQGRTKTVADYLSDAKVPRHRRALVPVLTTSGGEIVWIVGMRSSEVARVTATTTRAVRVEAKPLRA